MAWFKGDDKLPRNTKVLATGDAAACWFYVCCLAYCAEQLTDGFIAESAIPIIAPHVQQPDETVAVCVKAGLLQIVAGGYSIPDFLAYNPSRESVLKKREADRLRIEEKRSRTDVADESPASLRVPSRPVPVTTSPSSSTTSPAEQPASDGDEKLVEQVLQAIAAHKFSVETQPIKNPPRWKAKVMANDRAELGSTIARLVGEFPTAPPSMLAAAALGQSTPHLAGYRKTDAA